MKMAEIASVLPTRNVQVEISFPSPNPYIMCCAIYLDNGKVLLIFTINDFSLGDTRRAQVVMTTVHENE